MAPLLARTASDPAPMMSLDSTTVMPPLSLLPPLPSSRGRGRPPVPMSPSRSSSARWLRRRRLPRRPPAVSEAPTRLRAPVISETAVVSEPAPETTAPRDDRARDRHRPAGTPLRSRRRASTPGCSPTRRPRLPPLRRQPPARPPVVETSGQPWASPRFLATVTRLPVAPLMATPETPELPELEDLDEPAAAPAAAAPVAWLRWSAPHPAPARSARSPRRDVVGRLEALGMPAGFLGASFADDVAVHGTYAALTRALALRLPKAPELPSGAGEVLFVVGPGVETLRAAQSLAAVAPAGPRPGAVGHPRRPGRARPGGQPHDDGRVRDRPAPGGRRRRHA